MTTIDTTHIDYDRHAPTWQTIEDICNGEHLQNYLVKLNPADTSTENEARNKAFFDRAVFYAIAGYTSRGMTGMMFRKDPVLNVPPVLDKYIKQNIDGQGVSIYQQSQSAAKKLIRTGRCGLWVDYPRAEGGTSVSDLEKMRVFATTKLFAAKDIADWEVATEGARVFLSRVLLRDTATVDGKDVDVRLELLVTEGKYMVREWHKIDGQWTLSDEYTPTDGSGKPWSEIPFQFLGSENNAHSIDHPPMLDIVRINIGHFNNSATHEDNLFYAGIIQPWMSGVDPDDERLAKIVIGSGNMIGVPMGEQFGFAQARAEGAIREAMRDKVEMAIGLGAMFIQPGSAAKTATQSEGEQEVQHSVLSLISANVSEGYTQALRWMARYMNAAEDACEYTVSQEFVTPNATPQELQAVVASWFQGAIPFSDLVAWSQRHGYIDQEKTVEQVAEEVQITKVPNLGQVA